MQVLGPHPRATESISGDGARHAVSTSLLSNSDALKFENPALMQDIYQDADSHAEVTEVVVISSFPRYLLKLRNNRIKLKWFPGNGNH